MGVSFRTKKLQKLANNSKHCKKKLGEPMAKKVRVRLDAIRLQAETLEDLRYMPGKFHELREDRKGQFACHLVGQNRLIFCPQENPIPTDD